MSPTAIRFYSRAHTYFGYCTAGCHPEEKERRGINNDKRQKRGKEIQDRMNQMRYKHTRTHTNTHQNLGESGAKGRIRKKGKQMRKIREIKRDSGGQEEKKEGEKEGSGVSPPFNNPRQPGLESEFSFYPHQTRVPKGSGIPSFSLSGEGSAMSALGQSSTPLGPPHTKVWK